MTCEACAIAEKTPSSGLYMAFCMSCRERAIAQGMPYHQAEQAGRLTAEYKRVMTLTFGDDWPAAHERIKEWKRKLKESNADASQKS